MSINKKLWYGDGHKKSINEDISGTPVNPGPSPEGNFTFDRMDITFDTMLRTFDEL